MCAPLVSAAAVMLMLTAGCAGALNDESAPRSAPPPRETAAQPAAAPTTRPQISIEQRQAMGDLAAGMYALTELDCWDLRNVLADRGEQVTFQLNMETIAQSLTRAGLDPQTAVVASRLKPPPEVRHRVGEWCRPWKATVRRLGDYLIGVAERGRG